MNKRTTAFLGFLYLYPDVARKIIGFFFFFSLAIVIGSTQAIVKKSGLMQTTLSSEMIERQR